MKNIKILVLFIVFILIIFGIILYFVIDKNTKNNPNNNVYIPSPTQTISYIPTSVFTSPTILIHPTITIPIDQRINLSGLEMNNFYKTAVKIDEDKDVVMEENDKFRISYYSKYSQFLISILTTPFEQVKFEAEKKFLELIGVSETEACKLDVIITTPQFVNPEFAGKEYLLSFCRSE